MARETLKEKVEGWREITAQMEAEYAAPKRRDYGTRVSVIVPVYQAEATLTECVMSIKQQSYTDLEILLVDDGSTDEGAVLSDRLAAQDDRIRALHRENGGVSSARNAGLDNATGTYVMFVDADDLLLPGAIETLMRYETESKADLISMGYEAAAPQTVSGYYYIDYGIFERDTHVWGKLFYRPALEDIRFDEGLTIGEDMIFLVQLALRFESKLRVQLIPEAGYDYRDNEQGAMRKPFTPSFADNLTCWERCEALLVPHIRKLSPYAVNKLHVIQILNALLVTERIALLDETEWKTHEDVLNSAGALIKQALKGSGVFAALTLKDKARVLYYRWNRAGYMRTYRARKL